MDSDVNQEILEDFLSEAGELLETLNEELIQLEHRPDDIELLNKAFRAFHTIKGGAGFVGLDPLVEVCHRAEEIFSMLRDGTLVVTSDLMDPLLETLDVVNDQFSVCREGRMPAAAPGELLDRLAAVALSTDQDKIPESVIQAADSQPFNDGDCDDSGMLADPAEQAFESLLDDVVAGSPAGESDPGEAVEIDDDEFEALLDSLHGVGGAPREQARMPTVQSTDSEAAPDKPDTPQRPDAQHAQQQHPVAIGVVPNQEQKRSTDQGHTTATTPARTVDTGKGNETVRIDVARLDTIMNLVGELVLVRNRLNTYRQNHRDSALGSIADSLDRVTADIQTAVMDSRLQPVRKVFSRFPRLVRDLSKELNKPVDLSMSGEDTELDKKILDALSEPLVHLVRNAVDHGIEPPAERESAGKPRNGQVLLAAGYSGDRVEIIVQEDGRGLDASKLCHRAIEKGVITAEAAAEMSEREAFELIFQPGFSTSAQVSNISGRGVGMDAVRNCVSELNGRVDIESKPGGGTRFTISVPLTLAILPTLMVKIAGQRFALPLSSVSEVCELNESSVQYIDGHQVIIIRDAPLPLFRASSHLGFDQTTKSAGQPEQVIALELENRRIGLVVDEILDQEEAVLKPLGAFVRDLPGMGGGTITGDGHIALVLDVADLLRRSPLSKHGDASGYPVLTVES